jgi:hypothetical protein
MGAVQPGICPPDQVVVIGWRSNRPGRLNGFLGAYRTFQPEAKKQTRDEENDYDKGQPKTPSILHW